jgi:hypothetical protein
VRRSAAADCGSHKDKVRRKTTREAVPQGPTMLWPRIAGCRPHAIGLSNSALLETLTLSAIVDPCVGTYWASQRYRVANLTPQ